ncbi:MAG: response regulator transcription factor [Clostridiales bacterium]|nr:response regulator transcription factor [Clostridiales bacterium]
MKTHVLIVEDNKYMLEFFEEMFRGSSRFALAGTLRDAGQTEYFCRANSVDLILMDVQTLHGHSGLDAAECIRRQFPSIKIVVVTSLADAGVLKKARQMGVDSLWYKDHGEDEITDVVERTLAGEHIFPDREPNVEIGAAWSDELSETQKNILRLYIRGNSYSAIGKKLFLEEATVKYHMNQMIQKCGFRTKQELIAAAIESTAITAMGTL